MIIPNTTLRIKSKSMAMIQIDVVLASVVLSIII